jgi:hypothetical protein
MIVKKINGIYMPEPDRFMLKITIENEKKEADQYQLILTRRIVKSMLLHFRKLLLGKSLATSAQKIQEQKIKKTTQDLAHIFGPLLVTHFSLKKSADNDMSFILNLTLRSDQKFQMNCSKKILEFLFNLFMKLQEKAAWDLEGALQTKKIRTAAGTAKPIKRTLH